jgi:tRNA-2-methylthio-N6-dimethylallyladenosine synthase
MNKVFILTHGCQMNEYDSSKMADVLASSHHLEKTNSVEDADVLLMNTCSIREKAQDKVYSELGRWRELKEKNPNIVIGVGGCVASQEGAAILKRAPYVDMIFGPQTLHRLGEMLSEVQSSRKSVVDISFPEIEKFDSLPQARPDGISAYVSIMEGCSKYCSFCVVPYTRGEEISRPLDDVLAEIINLTEQGVREITLLGQNVNDYRGPMHTGQTADLAMLIQYMSAIDNMLRIRFTTSHPLAFSNNLIQAYAEVPQLANHLHLPVQSGSDRILAAMKRGYTALEFKSKIRRLRKVRPDISISSDFIIGFPGETEADFEATMDLIDEIGFDNSYSFIYSPRPGTPAAQLPDNVPMQVKKERLNKLQARIRLNTHRISDSMLGTKQKILVTGPCTKEAGKMVGKTENNRSAVFAGSTDLIGSIVTIKVTKTAPYLVQGIME